MARIEHFPKTPSLEAIETGKLPNRILFETRLAQNLGYQQFGIIQLSHNKLRINIMKNIIIAATIALLSSTSAFAAKPPRCNPAIQNWENGSKTTCVYASTNTIGMKTAEKTPETPTTPDTPEDLNDILR
jgi:hypothetical protein